MLNLQNAGVYTDFKGLGDLKTQAKKESPAALKEAAKQFEAIFIGSLLKGMRDAKLADGVGDSDQSKFYTEMYDKQLAMHLSGKPGLGLADLIVKQLSHGKPGDDDDAGKNEKPALEDYLNRSAGASKTLPAHAPAAGKLAAGPVDTDTAGGSMTVSAYVANDNPLNEMIEIPLKEGVAQPIQSAEDFVRLLHPYAVQAARELGVEPRVILAQAALETGWGRSLVKNGDGGSSFNLFNIKADKAWQGKQARVATLEFDQGVAKKVNAGFRSYGSFQESFHDYAAFIKSNPRYGDALKQAGNAERYLHELQQAGYATDPHYADKIISIYNGETLTGSLPETVVALK